MPAVLLSVARLKKDRMQEHPSLTNKTNKTNNINNWQEDIALKYRLLVHEAQRWQGVRAQQDGRSGEVVSLFQGWNDRIERVAWCMAFVQYCLKQTDLLYDQLMQRSQRQQRHCLFATQHVMTAWEHTAQQQRRYKPQPGFVALWRRYDDERATQAGHAGIVVDVADAQHFITVEGNTRLWCGSSSQRGVARKRRSHNTQRGPLRLCGFLDPWPDPAAAVSLASQPVSSTARDNTL